MFNSSLCIPYCAIPHDIAMRIPSRPDDTRPTTLAQQCRHAHTTWRIERCPAECTASAACPMFRALAFAAQRNVSMWLKEGKLCAYSIPVYRTMTKF